MKYFSLPCRVLDRYADIREPVDQNFIKGLGRAITHDCMEDSGRIRRTYSETDRKCDGDVKAMMNDVITGSFLGEIQIK